MTIITPGIDFLANGALYLCFPTGLVLVLHRATNARLSVWTIAGALTACAPVLFSGAVLFERWMERRSAKKLGAVRAAETKGKWIANLDLPAEQLKNLMEGYTSDGLWELFEHEGPKNIVCMRVLYKNYYFTIEPSHIKAILATDFYNFEKGQSLHVAMKPLFGNGVFNTDGDMWKFHRSITRPFFHRERLSDYDIFDRHAEQVIKLIQARMEEGHAIDFQDLVSRFTMDSATEFLFGTCVDSLHASIPYPHNITPPPSHNPNSPANTFSSAFLEAQILVTERNWSEPFWPLFEILKDKPKQSMKIVNKFVEPLIEEAVAKQRARKESGEEDLEKGMGGEESLEGKTLLDHLVQVSTDPNVVREETINILLAGRDTTSCTLSFAMYLLSTHPEVLAKMRQEIHDVLGPDRRPTGEDIANMRYVKAVINETLRLYPPVPFNARQSIKDTTWPSATPGEPPVFIQGGRTCSYSVFLMHRRKDLWGPDAELFDPDRFLDERVQKYLVPNPFIFLPFNGGPRICLGQQFAYNEVAFLLARIFQSFSSVEMDSEAQPPTSKPPASWATLGTGRKAVERVRPKTHLTMYIDGGLWVRMKGNDIEG